MRIIAAVLCILTLALPVWAGTFRDDFSDGNLDGWQKVQIIDNGKVEEKGGFTTSGLISVLADERKEAYVREMTFEKYAVSSSWEDRFPSITAEMTLMKFAKDTIMKFVIERIEIEIQSRRREIELTDDESKLLEIMKSNNELEREKKRIREELSN